MERVLLAKLANHGHHIAEAYCLSNPAEVWGMRALAGYRGLQEQIICWGCVDFSNLSLIHCIPFLQPSSKQTGAEVRKKAILSHTQMDSANVKSAEKLKGTYVFEGVPTWHLLLKLFLQLLASTYGLLVSGKVRKLLQSGVWEVLWEVLTTALVGREQLLKKHTVKYWGRPCSARQAFFSN